jgi:phenylalanine-4-hydroxylase
MRIMLTDYRIDNYQELYFVIDNYEQLFDETTPDITLYYEELRRTAPIPAGVVLPTDRVISRRNAV